MRFVLIGCVLVGGSVLAFPQTPGSIEGFVTDSVTQSPVRKAQVTLIPRTAPLSSDRWFRGGGVTLAPRPASASRIGDFNGAGMPAAAITDSAGSFAFRNLAPGRYAVQAQHPRYPMRQGGPVITEVEVKASDASRVTLTLVPGAVISGKVTDEDGDPLQGCSVQVRARGTSIGNQRSETSNERGEYRVSGLSAGKYNAFVQCVRSVFQPRPFSAGPAPLPMFGYPPQYYPQAADADSATALEAAAGAEITAIDFQLKPSRVYTVTGVVSGIESNGNRNLSVMLASANERFGLGARGGRVNPDTGVFEINNVFPGSYILMATQQAADPKLPPMSARQPIDVTDRPLQVRVMLQKAVDIPVTLVMEGERVVQPRQVNIQVMEVGQSVGVHPRVEIQPDGSFLMKNVSPGVWRIAAFGPNLFLRAIEADGQTILGQTFDSSKGMVGHLRFYISTRTATIQAKGNAGLVYTLSDDGDLPFPRLQTANADPQGRVQMQGLVPGKYKIFEGATPEDTMLLQTVTVTEGTVLDLDLSKRPSGVRNPR